MLLNKLTQFSLAGLAFLTGTNSLGYFECSYVSDLTAFQCRRSDMVIVDGIDIPLGGIPIGPHRNSAFVYGRPAAFAGYRADIRVTCASGCRPSASLTYQPPRPVKGRPGQRY